MTDSTAYAHYFAKTSRRPAELVLTDGPDLRSIRRSIPVSGKAEARRKVLAMGALAWNF